MVLLSAAEMFHCIEGFDHYPNRTLQRHCNQQDVYCRVSPVATIASCGGPAQLGLFLCEGIFQIG